MAVTKQSGRKMHTCTRQLPGDRARAGPEPRGPDPAAFFPSLPAFWPRGHGLGPERVAAGSRGHASLALGQCCSLGLLGCWSGRDASGTNSGDRFRSEPSLLPSPSPPSSLSPLLAPLPPTGGLADRPPCWVAPKTPDGHAVRSHLR